MADEPPGAGSTVPGPARERRPAVWPWLVMPVVVLLMFYALHTVHQRSHLPAAASTATTGGPDNR